MASLRRTRNRAGTFWQGLAALFFFLLAGIAPAVAQELTGTWQARDGSIVEFLPDGRYEVIDPGSGPISLTSGSFTQGADFTWTLRDQALGDAVITAVTGRGGVLILRSDAPDFQEIRLIPYSRVEAILGASLPVFIALTVVLVGGAALLTGQALANTWQPAWKAVPYCVLLAAADRFLAYALFDGELLSVTGFAIGFIILLAICLTAYRATKTGKMVSQYPWLYTRAGPFSWKPRGP